MLCCRWKNALYNFANIRLFTQIELKIIKVIPPPSHAFQRKRFVVADEVAAAHVSFPSLLFVADIGNFTRIAAREALGNKMQGAQLLFGK